MGNQHELGNTQHLQRALPTTTEPRIRRKRNRRRSCTLNPPGKVQCHTQAQTRLLGSNADDSERQHKQRAQTGSAFGQDPTSARSRTSPMLRMGPSSQERKASGASAMCCVASPCRATPARSCHAGTSKGPTSQSLMTLFVFRAFKVSAARLRATAHRSFTCLAWRACKPLVASSCVPGAVAVRLLSASYSDTILSIRMSRAGVFFYKLGNCSGPSPDLKSE